MSLVDEVLRPALFKARGIAGTLGLRPHSVTVLSGTWSGPHTGDGDETQVRTPLLESGQNPQVVQMGDEQLTLSGLPKGSLEIGPITPPFQGGGTSLEIFDSVAAGGTVHLVVKGPLFPAGAKFRVVEKMGDNALHIMLRAKPTAPDSTGAGDDT